MHDPTLADVLKASTYAEDPFAAAKNAWNAAGRPAGNGALLRSAALGPVHLFDTAAVIADSKTFCQVRRRPC